MAETGHAKNVENWQKMIAACTGFGPGYNPSNANLTVASMNTLLTDVETEMDGVQTSIVPWKNPDTSGRIAKISIPVSVRVRRRYLGLLGLAEPPPIRWSRLVTSNHFAAPSPRPLIRRARPTSTSVTPPRSCVVRAISA